MVHLEEDKVENILQYWFGDGDWRGGLWFQGIDVLQVENGESKPQKRATNDAKVRTDQFIRETYGELIHQVAADEKSLGGGCIPPISPRSQVAKVVILDQFPRNAFRGTSQMFAYDKLASSVALRLLDMDDFISLTWNFKLFVYVCLTHSESEVIVNKAALGLSSLVSEIEATGNGNLAKKIRRVLKATEDHLSVLQKFGRYPHRNELLERPSTPGEAAYLQGKLPTWAKSVLPVRAAPGARPVGAPPPPRPSRPNILVLHSNRQNPNSFSKATVPVLKSEYYTLTFLPAPHAYCPRESAATALADIGPGDGWRASAGNLCWWNASDDPASMIYEGLEDSLQAIDDICREQGPFQGLLGFSQGGCLAGIVARLQNEQSPLVRYCQFEFYVSISGFVCRDVRPEFNMTTRKASELINAPSFHVWGEADTLVENHRSQSLHDWFLSPTALTHPGGHFRGAISHWPVREMESWIQSLSLSTRETGDTTTRGEVSSAESTPEDVPPLHSFDDKLQSTLGKNRYLLEPLRTTYSSAKWGKSRLSRRQLRILQPCGLVNNSITQHPTWRAIVAATPFYSPNGLTREDIVSFVQECVANIDHTSPSLSPEGPVGAMISDLLLLAYCAYPFPSYVPPFESKKNKQMRQNGQGEVFFWLLEAIMRVQHTDSGPPDSMERMDAIRCTLDDLVEIGGWNDVTRLDLLVCSGTSQRIICQDEPRGAAIVDDVIDSCEVTVPNKRNIVLDAFESDTHNVIINLLATRLHMDMRVLTRSLVDQAAGQRSVPGYDELVTKQLEITLSLDAVTKQTSDTTGINSEQISIPFPLQTSVSSCASYAPRLKSYTDKATGLASSVGQKLLELKLQDDSDMDHPTEAARFIPTGNSAHSRDEKRNIASKIFYRTVLRNLNQYLKSDCESINRDDLALRKAAQVRDWKLRMKQAGLRNTTAYSFSSEEAYQLLLDEPLSYAVLNPEPEPVDIATREEMAQLHNYFRSQNATARSEDDALDREVTFEKGTLCMDGRLDLCKQVVGPSGVESLMSSLALDFTGKYQVEHLLLGNNICGDGLGFAMAALIESGQSGLTTWYIAGNRLTEKGIRPICDALSKDVHVQQLWLKRNPLKQAGARLVSDMLRWNSTIIVLDLVNTGLLDAGAAVLFSALGSYPTQARSNSTLQHLYMDGNGLTVTSAEMIGEYLKTGRNCLKTLSIGGNRLGNKGTTLVANGLEFDTHVTRLGLASVGMGSEGGRMIAKMLASNTALLHVDLGLMKFTAALNEVPNRIGLDGANVLADCLRYHNRTLRSLVLLNNNIPQAGLAEFRAALFGDHAIQHDGRESTFNSTLVRLELEQMGVPFNELTREEIRLAIRRNFLALSEEEKAQADEAINPAHLKNILSVYRVNGAYTN